MKMSIKQVEEELVRINSENSPFFQLLVKDERKGVQALLKKWRMDKKKEDELRKQFEEMSIHENKLIQEGFQYIAGLDEVGRGPLAGPVVAAAVILPKNFYLPGLTDSKKLSATKRELFYEKIKAEAISIGIGIVDANTIDEVNIYEATKLAMIQAINKLHIKPDYLLIDAMKLNVNIQQESIVKGDSKSISIAASSVIAKVTRDSYMIELGEKFPQYGFRSNMGYGTKEHVEAIEAHGVLAEHRRSFTPIKDIVS
ncbi:ribonuclease HII [Sutcliffiella cohnii]|uniref:ribonuclease HII n=1 Tax=Sutcliffiella cohnii TaxID=33932 RepID=UPI00399D6854